ncbi:MAG: phosphatase PAP2 family protein [Armatimonadota bacterium]
MREIDVWLFKLLNVHLANPIADRIMLAATTLGIGSVAVAICLALLLIGQITNNTHIRKTAYAGIVACIISLIIVQTIKHLWDKPRPLAIIFEARPVGKALFWNSFPSGHTATAFATAIAMGAFVPKLRIILLLLATLVAVSRIYVGAHYPTDVIGGAALGTIVGEVCAGFVSRRTSRDTTSDHDTGDN